MSDNQDKPCQCGNKYVVNKTHNLCGSCNYKRLNGGKARFEVAREKESTKVRKAYQIKRTSLKRKKTSLKRSPVRSTQRTKEKRAEMLRKDREVYLKVFNSKDNCCEECGVILSDRFEDDEGNIIDIFRFSHILGKAAYPEFRHNKLNMNLLCLKCHQIWEFSSKEKMKIYKGNQILIEKMRNL